jgi:hypothetical protein
MKLKSNNPPAFPSQIGDRPHQGMALRDYYAAKVMQGVLANNPAIFTDPTNYVAFVYKVADAMLNQREQ